MHMVHMSHFEDFQHHQWYLVVVWCCDVQINHGVFFSKYSVSIACAYFSLVMKKHMDSALPLMEILVKPWMSTLVL